MSKLGEISINGGQVSVFEPPLNEPDFPWVDVTELAACYLGEDAGNLVVRITRQFGNEKRAYAVARNGDNISTIVCHAMAQGLCGMIDFTKGWRGDPDDGPVHREYCLAFGIFAADHWPMTFDDIRHAFQNPGGEYLRQDLRFSDGDAE